MRAKPGPKAKTGHFGVDDWMTPKQISRDYLVRMNTVYKWLKKGGWKRAGGRWLVRKGDLENYLRKGERSMLPEDDASVATLEGLDFKRQGNRLDFIDSTQKTFYVRPLGVRKFIPIVWEPWQLKNWIRPVYYDTDKYGVRKKRLAIISVPCKEGKTCMAAAAVWYALVFDWDNEPEVYSCAGTKDQAKLVFKQVSRAISASPYAQAMIKAKKLNVYKDVIEIETPTRAGTYRALAREAFGSHGGNQSLTVWDEVWNQPDAEMWEAMKESAARTEPLTMIVSYAGYGWQRVQGNLWFDLWTRGMEWTEHPENDPEMHFYHSNDNQSSWKFDEHGSIEPYLKRMRRYFTEDGHFQRMVHNAWVDQEDAALTEEDIKAMFARAVELEFEETWVPQPGWRYVTALDLGLTGDATVACVCGRKIGSDLVRVCTMKRFAKRRIGKLREVDIEAVEEWITRAWKTYGGKVYADPDEFKGSIQRLTKKGIPIEAWNFVGPNINRATKVLVGAIRERQIASYYVPALESELRMARIVTKSYGMRLEIPRIRSTRKKEGQHGDHVTVLMIAIDVLLEKDIASPDIWSIKI